MQGELLLRCLALVPAVAVFAITCSWSNEGCDADEECCSKSCWRAHEGTNPRCRHSSLGETCVFDYHCRDDLICGRYYNCCSPYWKMCTKTADCCERDHVCRPVEGFVYDRCLYPAAAPTSLRACAGTTFLAALAVTFFVNGLMWCR